MSLFESFRTIRMKSGTSVRAVSLETPPEEAEAPYKPISLPLIRKMLGHLRPFRNQYFLGISLGLTHYLLDLTSPLFIGNIINFVSRGFTPEEAPGAIRTLLIRYIGFWALVVFASVMFQRWTIIVMTRAGESVQFILRKQLFERLQVLSMSYYDKTKLGRIISRCTSDIGSLREINVWGIWHVIAHTTSMTVAAGFMLYTDWRLFLAVAWLAVPLFFFNRYYLRRVGHMWQLVREGFTRVSTNLAENITGMRVVSAFNRQDPNLGVFNSLQIYNTGNNVTLARINGVYQPLLEFIKFFGRVIILLYGGYALASGRLSGKEFGAVVAFFLYWDYFMNPVIAFGQFYNNLMQAMAGAERVYDLLETKPDVFDLPDATPLPRIDGRVRFENVTFGYNPDRPVLHDVNFEAQPGQMFALVGATGSGKSSIISLIARFYQPQGGRVLVDGTDIRHVIGDTLHRQMGLVLQVNYLFTGTVMENIRYARPTATPEEVVAAAREIGSYDAIISLAQGFDSEVGERGANMSLGQRQLICFTRAYLADPRIFMLDEATSAVDTATEMLVQKSLERLLEGRTTFIVAHRLSTIMKADQILVIDAGRVIERGTHRELVAAGGKYAGLHHQFTSQHE